MAYLEEAISLHREALELRPSTHPDRSDSLNNLSNALLDRHRCTRVMADLEEAISLDREALKLRPSPHPYRSDSLYNLALSLHDMYKMTHVLSDLQEAITCREELLELHYPVGHADRPGTLRGLARLLQKHFDVMGKEEDLSRIEALREEADRLSDPPTESTQ
jgi:tetratricopeptide (TPR) repeat protein